MFTPDLDHSARISSPADSPVEIAVQDAGKAYQTQRGEVRAVTPTNLEVCRGEFVVMLGPSGCGKTTILRMIAGLLQPTEGHVRVNGLDPADARRPDADLSTGMVFQEANLLPWRTVLENIEFPLHYGKDKLDKGAARRRATELCEQVGLSGFEDRLPRELSGGMRQRVAIARAISTGPRILLMDEPFGALDAFTRDRLNLDVQDLWMRLGITAVLVTHSISEAAFLADRVVLFSARPGRVVDEVTVELPRPRTLDMQSSPEFQSLVLDLRHRLGEAR